jgi:hypothetical protein
MIVQYRDGGGRSFFAASNSRRGFTSYYEACFRHKVDRLLCIKGGPGTGKSTLMRRVANEAERRGWRAEYYCCSSDADSLDAILLYGKGQSLGLLDATLPHAFEPGLPGVEEEILDLGQFWDGSCLTEKKEEIIRLNRQKSEGYRMAYRYLAGVGEMSDVLRDVVVPTLDEGRLCRTVNRLLRDCPSHQGDGNIQIGLCDSIGMRGRVRLDTYLSLGERVCLVEDYYDSAYHLMRLLSDEAYARGMRARVSYHPILSDEVDALYLPDGKTVFFACAAEDVEDCRALAPHARVISMRRLVHREAFAHVRGQVRYADRLREGLLGGAEEALARVSEAHDALERLYGAAMDFVAVERYTKELCRKWFDGE